MVIVGTAVALDHYEKTFPDVDEKPLPCLKFKAKNLDECLDYCDAKARLLGHNENALQLCYCMCWKKFPPTPRNPNSTEALRKQWEALNGKEWPVDSNGNPFDAHHIKPLADGGADTIDNVTPVPNEKHKEIHKYDRVRWGKRDSRRCLTFQP